MRELLALILKALLTNRGAILALIIMPLIPTLIMLFASSGSISINVPVYICVSSVEFKKLLTMISKEYNIKNIHILEKCVSDPNKFVLDRTAKIGTPVLLIVVGQDRIDIYTTSIEIGSEVKRSLEELLLKIYYPNLRLPVNVSLHLPPGLSKPEALRQAMYARGIAMFTIIESILCSMLTIQLVSFFPLTGLHKRIAMYRESKRKIALAVSISGLIVAIIFGILLLSESSIILRVDPRYTILNSSIWLAYILTYIFTTGLGLILITIAVRLGLEPLTVQGVVTLIILFFMFSPGIFIPIEVLPEPITKLVQLIPVTNLVTQAYLSTLGITLNMQKLIYSIITTIATYIIGTLTFNPYRRT